MIELARRRIALVAASCALVALVAHNPRRSNGRLALTAAHGTVELVDSDAGTSIVSASNLEPGQSAIGTVALSNEGSASGPLFLVGGAPLDSPGQRGGRLSHRLALRIEALGVPGSPVVSGTLDQLAGCHALGLLAPGTTRTYRFTATLPDGGGADNALQGSSTSVSETWTLNRSACGGAAAVANAPRSAPRIHVLRARRCRAGRRRLAVRIASGTPLHRVVVVVDGRRALATRRRRFALRPRLARRRNRLVVRAQDARGEQATLRERLPRCP